MQRTPSTVVTIAIIRNIGKNMQDIIMTRNLENEYRPAPLRSGK
jgi:hypothetical protein